MKRILYVDFENVSSAGLNGMSDLTTDDEVKIFLGPKCSKMSLIEADNIFHGDATVELIKNDQIAKNALDFIIMVHLGYDVAKKAGDLFFIISNDKGYDPAIHEMQVLTGETIARYQDIAQVIKRNDVKPGLFSRLFGRKKADETTDATANATEHEVIKRGRSNRTGTTYGNRSNGNTRTDGNRSDNYRGNGNRNGNNSRSGGNRNGSNRNGYNNGYNNGNRNNAANGNSDTRNTGNRNNNRRNNPNTGSSTAMHATQNTSTRPVAASEQKTEQKTIVRATVLKEEPKKPTVIKKETAPVAPQAPKNLLSPEDDYLDDMSIAELRAQLQDDKKGNGRRSHTRNNYDRKNNNSTIVEKEPEGKETTSQEAVTATAKAAHTETQSKTNAPHSHGRTRIVLSDSEKALVDRAVAETTNLGDFHNYILKELHDNDRATEIYKSEKHRVKIVRPEKSVSEKPVTTETTASETE